MFQLTALNSKSRLSVAMALALLLLPSANVRADAPTAIEKSAPTQWSGSETLCGFDRVTFQFYPDGRAVMLDSKTTSDGVWQLNGQQMQMWFSAGRVYYSGTINGNFMSGTAQNGQTCWSWCVSGEKFSGPIQPAVEWTGSENLCGYGGLTFQLYAGGRAVMLDAQAMSEGIWMQNGQQFTLRFSGGRVVYAGTLNGNTITGTADNGCSNWSFSDSKNG